MTAVEIVLVSVSLSFALGAAGFLVFLSIRQAIKRKNFVSRLNEHDKGVIADYMHILWN